MLDLYISWSEYHQKIEYLAAKIYQSGWTFDQIVCIAKGGLRVGDLLARIYDLPLAVLAASSYSGSGNQVRGSLDVGSALAMTTPMGRRVLLVDDLVDSGITLDQTQTWLRQHHAGIAEVRTAVIWYKACSVTVPDYYVDYLHHNPWIHQPFEGYEQTSAAQLAATYFPAEQVVS